jgi:uncharacterized tellurite resistance protein B-like protein
MIKKETEDLDLTNMTSQRESLNKENRMNLIKQLLIYGGLKKFCDK